MWHDGPTCSRGEECRQLRLKLRRRLEGAAAAAAAAQQWHRGGRRRQQRTPQRLLQGGPSRRPNPCEGAGRLPCSSRAGHTSCHLNPQGRTACCRGNL